MNLTFPHVPSVHAGGIFKVSSICPKVRICRVLWGVDNFGPHHAYWFLIQLIISSPQLGRRTNVPFRHIMQRS